jgi:hypothetical protein
MDVWDMEEMRNTYNILVSKPEWRPLGRHRHRWDENAGLSLKETVFEDVYWFHLAQERLHCEHGNETFGYIESRESF